MICCIGGLKSPIPGGGYDTYQPAVYGLSVRELTDGEQDIIHQLAAALRRAGAATGKIKAMQSIVDMGTRHRNSITRLEFVRTSKRGAVVRCEEQVNAARRPSQRATWRELLTLAQAQLAGGAISGRSRVEDVGRRGELVVALRELYFDWSGHGSSPVVPLYEGAGLCCLNYTRYVHCACIGTERVKEGIYCTLYFEFSKSP